MVSDAFLTTNNFLNILQQSSELSMLVIAESLILIAGKFDLSLESVVGLAPMLAAWLIVDRDDLRRLGPRAERLARDRACCSRPARWSARSTAS